MRKDIEINTNTHDLVLHNQRSPLSYNVTWSDTGSTLQGTVYLPADFTDSQLSDGIPVHIPYTSSYKPFQIKFVKSGSNPAYNKWMDVKVKMYNTHEESVIRVSELIAVNINGQYIMQPNKEGTVAYVYSGKESDIQAHNANFQNRDLLLQCIPSNSYRYPISGVGLIKYLHSSLEQSDLGVKLRTEFEKDGVLVKNAAFDSSSGDIDLDLEFLR